MIGSISEITVGFYKKGEEGTQVDNSPKIATATNKGNYSITPNVPVGFSATTSTTPSGSIECDITRFTASYGTLKVNYNASNISKLAIKVDGVDKGNVSISSSGTAEFDLRGLIKVSKINFILTGSGATSFEASKIYFEVTPYCTDYWHATSRFSRCESLGIGGHVIAEYQNGVGWDYCQTKVVNWNQDFANMEVRFKLGGDKRAGLPERFGVDANSNHTIYELQFHTFEDSCVKIGDEYVVTISLAGISKLGSLNFYFDSDFIEDFSGTRRVEITSIKFLPTVPTISSMVDLLNEGCTVEHLNDSWEHITYTTKTEWDKLAATASGVNEDCKYLKVEVKPTKDVKVGIYWSPLNSPSTENQILGHTTISSEYVQTIDISSLNLPSSFSFHIFIDATIKTGGNDLQLRLSFTDQAI